MDCGARVRQKRPRSRAVAYLPFPRGTGGLQDGCGSRKPASLGHLSHRHTKAGHPRLCSTHKSGIPLLVVLDLHATSLPSNRYSLATDGCGSHKPASLGHLSHRHTMAGHPRLCSTHNSGIPLSVVLDSHATLLPTYVEVTFISSATIPQIFFLFWPRFPRERALTADFHPAHPPTTGARQVPAPPTTSPTPRLPH